MTFGPAVENDPRLRTADGKPIVDNGRYFDYYDMYWVTVHFDSGTGGPKGEYWDGWFRTTMEDGGTGPLLNGERMSSVVPSWVKS